MYQENENIVLLEINLTYPAFTTEEIEEYPE